MYTIKLNEIMQGRSYPEAGMHLYDAIMMYRTEPQKIIIDFEGVSALPSMFLNVSIGKYLDNYGIDSLKEKIAFSKISKGEIIRISEYIRKYQDINSRMNK